MTNADPNDPSLFITDPHVIACAHAEAAARDSAVIGSAESAIAVTRHHDLARQHHELGQKLDDAYVALGTAQALGDTDDIAQARAVYEQCRHDYSEAADPITEEMSHILLDRIDHLATMLKHALDYTQASHLALTTAPDPHSPETVALRTEITDKIAWIKELLTQ